MKSIAIFLVIVTAAQAGDRPDIRFGGTVLDGLDRPVSNATVRLFNGHMGLTEFQIDAETDVVTDSHGTFSGSIAGEVAKTYRIVSKNGYAQLKHFGNWKTNETIRLLRTAGLTTNAVESIPTLAPAAQEGTVLEFLGSDGDLRVGGFLLACFQREDVFRPILLKAMRHPSKHAASRAKKVLAFIGHPDDLPWLSKKVKDEYGEQRNQHGVFVPEHSAKGETIDEAIQHASQGMLEEWDKGASHAKEPVFNKARDRAIVSWEMYTGPVNARGCSLYFTKIKGHWVFTHYVLNWIA